MKRILTLFACLCAMHLTAQDTERLYLSGTGSDDTRTWSFRCSEGMNSGKWSRIEVPSCWELQGFGGYTYGRYYKTKGAQPAKEYGEYRTDFKVPKEWADKRVYLVFEGVMTDTEARLNGESAGPVHQGGFTEFEYEVTDLLLPGKKNRLEVTVRKHSANKSVNSAERQADWWLFGGIYRPVYLKAVPKTHIRRIAVDPRMDGTLHTEVHLSDPLPEGYTLRMNLREAPSLMNGGKAGERSKTQVLALDTASTQCLPTRWEDVKPWDPEHPHLYHLTLDLLSEEGKVLHTLTERIGFRTIEFRRHDGIYINNVRAIAKGTNRHSFHPESGRTTSKALSLQDALLIKEMNMNAVRSHYAPDKHFLDVCDSLGLLYLNELAGWQTRYDDTIALKQVRELVIRDVNHPCIYLWSNGNEGGWNTTVDTRFADYDPQQRHVVHPWADFNGIDTHHYPAYQTGTYRLHNGQQVFMPTEFLHGKYDKGQGAALEDMWSHWTRSPLFAGGFIWAYVDEAVRRTDLPTGESKGRVFGQKGFKLKDCILDSDGGHGPDGCMDPYRQPEASFYTIREVWSPVYIDGLHVTPSFDGRVLVSNRYLFTHLSECDMKYRVKMLDGSILNEGKVGLPALAPGESGYARFDMPSDFHKGDVLELIAYNRGEEVCNWTAPIHRADEQTHLNFSPLPHREDWGGSSITFSPDGTFSTDSLEGPFPVGMKAEVIRHKQRTEADGTVVNTFWYKGGIDSIRWRQTPDGLLHMDAVMLNDERGHGLRDFLTEESKWTVGLTFHYPEEQVDSVHWIGRGPYRVWRNRLKGQQFGLWSIAYNNTVTGDYNSSTPPLYPEFKGYRSDFRWMEMQNKDGRSWRVSTLNDGLYLRLFTPEEPIDRTPGEMGGLQETQPRKQERSMVRFPDGDISFLLSIPPIQSYKPLEQLGPQSQPDNIRIKAGDEGFHIRLIFDFNKEEPLMDNPHKADVSKV